MKGLLGILLLLLVIGGLVAFAVIMTKGFNAASAQRQTWAEENQKRHGGQRTLEWDASRSEGAVDASFGPLVVEIPQKLGEPARFYEQGVVMGRKRLLYQDLKDVVVEGETRKGIQTLETTLRDSGKLWLYPKKGGAIGLMALTYRFEGGTMERIQRGLGYAQPLEKT